MVKRAAAGNATAKTRKGTAGARAALKEVRQSRQAVKQQLQLSERISEKNEAMKADAKRHGSRCTYDDGEFHLQIVTAGADESCRRTGASDD